MSVSQMSNTFYSFFFFIKDLMCHPSACGFLTSESDASHRGKDWHVPHVRHGGLRLVCRRTHIRLCLAVPLSHQGHSLKWQWKDHGVSFPVEHPSPWPLWGTVAPFRDPPQRLSPPRGLQSCVLAVSGGLGSQLQSEETMLPRRCMRAALLWCKLGGGN